MFYHWDFLTKFPLWCSKTAHSYPQRVVRRGREKQRLVRQKLESRDTRTMGIQELAVKPLLFQVPHSHVTNCAPCCHLRLAICTMHSPQWVPHIPCPAKIPLIQPERADQIWKQNFSNDAASRCFLMPHMDQWRTFAPVFLSLLPACSFNARAQARNA